MLDADPKAGKSRKLSYFDAAQLSILFSRIIAEGQLVLTGEGGS